MLSQISEGDSAWLKLERDGYVHGAMRTIGAATHRCAHHSPNIAQVDKKDPRMREVWLPDPGQVLVGCDADALELVCLAHYLGKWDDGEYAKALLMTIHLKDVKIFTHVIENIPVRDIGLVAAKIPPARLHWMMQSLSECMGKSVHFEFYVTWCESILLGHGSYLKHSGTSLLSALRAIHKAVGQTQKDLTTTIEDNIFQLDYIDQVRKIPRLSGE